MHIKEYLMDNGYKSRKFLLVLLTILLIVGAGVLWAIFGWPTPVLFSVFDNITTLTLGYCGISAARVALPTTSSALAKTITTNKTQPHSAINVKENLAGAKDLL